MAGYDNKLGEWFKQVEKLEQEVKAKKRPAAVSREKEAAGAQSQESPEPPVPASTVATMEEDDSRAAEVGPELQEELGTGTPRPVTRDGGGNHVLFDDSDLPPVEDFFSFLSRSEEPEEPREPLVEAPRDQRLLNLSEGTGEPRPIAKPRTFTAPEGLSAPDADVQSPPRGGFTPPAAEAEPDALVDQQEAGWERMPRHLQVLFSTPEDEVAQNSYRTFKETREELIHRLLDPSVTLEEAARILNVCPTTVRRYTNRGVLQHFRTAGNQRRFKLSDVLGFMESTGRVEAQ